MVCQYMAEHFIDVAYARCQVPGQAPGHQEGTPSFKPIRVFGALFQRNMAMRRVEQRRQCLAQCLAEAMRVFPLKLRVGQCTYIYGQRRYMYHDSRFLIDPKLLVDNLRQQFPNQLVAAVVEELAERRIVGFHRYAQYIHLVHRYLLNSVEPFITAATWLVRQPSFHRKYSTSIASICFTDSHVKRTSICAGRRCFHQFSSHAFPCMPCHAAGSATEMVSWSSGGKPRS